VAIDEERLYLLVDVVCATLIGHGRLGQRHPRRVSQDRSDRVGRWRAVHPSHDPVRPDLDLDAGRSSAQPTRRVASRPVRDHRAKLIKRNRKLGHRDHVAIGKVLESDVSDDQLGGTI